MLVTASGFKIPLSSRPRLAAGSEIVIGVRPEHVTLGGPLAIPAHVMVVEPTGYETQVIARLAGQDIVCVFRERLNGRPGDSIALGVQACACFFFQFLRK